MKKVTVSISRILISVFTLLFSLCFFSCSNALQGSAGNDASSVVYVNGSFSLGAALPESLARSVNASSRTAFPSLPSVADFTWIVYAYNVDAEYEKYYGTVSEDRTTYVVPVPADTSEKNYKVYIDVKSSDKILLSGTSRSFPISTSTDLNTSIDVALSADQTSSGDGYIGLEIDVSGTDIVRCNFAFPSSLSFDRTKDSDGKIPVSTPNSVARGAHRLAFSFYDEDGNLLYSFSEIINVFINLTTNTWVKNGAEPYLVTTTDEQGNRTTTCRITAAMVDAYKLTQIFVDPSATTSTESGTFLNPCRTFSDAMEKLTDVTKDYTIYIKGTVTGNQNITTSLSKDAEDGNLYHANTLTICGATGLNDAGIPQDALDGNGSGSVLSITTEVPVTIKNLKITGGNNSTGQGGGILIDSADARVFLSDGTLVTGNEAKNGGGVFVNQGNLFVYGSAVVGKSGVSSHAQNASGKYGNKAIVSGGGIGVGRGTLWLGYSDEDTFEDTSGGVLYNIVIGSSETHGGGIDNQKGTVYIARGNVSYNYARSTTGSTYTGCGGGMSTARDVTLTGTAVFEENVSDYGGAVYITKDFYNGKFEMTGGTIRSNHAVKEHAAPGDGWGDGGGVAIGSSGTFTMSGGTIIGNTAERFGGAVVVDLFGTAFYVSESAYIPYDSVHSCNDVYLKSGKKITLTGGLTPPSVCTDGIVAMLTPSDYTSGTQLVDRGGTVTKEVLAEAVSHFNLMPDTSNTTLAWKISDEGKLASTINAASLTTANYSNVTEIIVTDTAGMNALSVVSVHDSFNNFTEKIINLENNVVLSSDYVAINYFRGTFNGNGYTISGLEDQPALFNSVGLDGTIRDLTVEGSATRAGIAVALTSGIIEGCTSRVTVTCSDDGENETPVGGIVAEMNATYATYGGSGSSLQIDAIIRNCVNEGTVKSSHGCLGGITGKHANINTIIDSCVNTATVEYTGSGDQYVGGIAGSASGYIRNSINAGEVKGNLAYAVGGIAGTDNCLNDDKGLYNCVNLASVSGAYRAGGIVGYSYLHDNADMNVVNCFNAGNVSITDSTKTSVGTVIGEIYLIDGNSATYNIRSCFYKANAELSGVGTTSSNVTISGSKIPTSLESPSPDDLNTWVSANNSRNLYKTWTTKTVNEVTCLVPDVGYEWGSE